MSGDAVYRLPEFIVPHFQCAYHASQRITHGERVENGRWFAWLNGEPDLKFTAEFASDALAQALSAVKPPCEVHDVTPLSGLSELTQGRFEFAIGRTPCPDCGGTGKYVGMNAVEV